MAISIKILPTWEQGWGALRPLHIGVHAKLMAILGGKNSSDVYQKAAVWHKVMGSEKFPEFWLLVDCFLPSLPTQANKQYLSSEFRIVPASQYLYILQFTQIVHHFHAVAQHKYIFQVSRLPFGCLLPIAPGTERHWNISKTKTTKKKHHYSHSPA